MTSPQSRLKIEPLTSARFFAALFVVIYHTFPGLASNPIGTSYATKLSGIGYISVSFFFMLSGFILAIVYLAQGKAIDSKRFFLARFARIYPLYFVAMLLDLPHFLHFQKNILHQGLSESIPPILATVSLVQSWFGIQAINPPGWSLSTEAFFYAIFPLAGVALWKLSDRVVLPAALLIYGAGNLAVLTLFRARLNQQDYLPLPHLYVFLLGILLAKIFLRANRIPSQAARLQRWAPGMLIVAIAAVLLLPLTGLNKQEALLQHGLLAPIFALAIMGFSSSNSTVLRLFARPWLILLGEASYALYLIHYPIHSALRQQLERSGWTGFFLYLAAVIGLSILSYIYLEGPARRWILARVRLRSKETAVTSSLSQ